jgi:hypothetical protein
MAQAKAAAYPIEPVKLTFDSAFFLKSNNYCTLQD